MLDAREAKFARIVEILNLCSKVDDGCDVCPYLVKCRETYDLLVDRQGEGRKERRQQ